MRILTLCEQCRSLLESAYAVKSYYYDTATTRPEKKCQNCKKVRPGLKMYIIDKRRP